MLGKRRRVEFFRETARRDLGLIQPIKDRFRRQPRIRNQSSIRMQTTANRCRFNVDLDDTFVFHQLTTICGEIVQSCAKANYTIRLREQIISGGRGKRAKNIHVIGMFIEQAFGFECRCERRFQAIRQLDELLTRINRARARLTKLLELDEDDALELTDPATLSVVGRPNLPA